MLKVNVITKSYIAYLEEEAEFCFALSSDEVRYDWGLDLFRIGERFLSRTVVEDFVFGDRVWL